MNWIKCEDGAYVYEYMEPTWRFGISLEIDPEESGWFFVYVGGEPVLKSGRIGRVLHWVAWTLFQPAKKLYRGS